MKPKKKKIEIPWGLIGIWGIVFLIALVCIFTIKITNEDMKVQLQECEARGCHLKEGYWGFRTVCDVDIFGQEDNKNTVVSHYFHKDIKSCIDSLEFYFLHDKCEVLKEHIENKVFFD